MPRQKPWKHDPDLRATDEEVYLNRREMLAAMGVATLGMSSALVGCTPGLGQDVNPDNAPGDNVGERVEDPAGGKYPFARNADYSELDRSLTPAHVASKYNNFYEFSLAKDVHRHCAGFTTNPWSIEVVGECDKPQTFKIEDIVKWPLEERLYRFRCVEAWSMAVPWTGISLSHLLKKVEPNSDAKYVRFLTVHRPAEMPEQKAGKTYAAQFPYYEGLRMDEAMHELTMLVTGIYGRPLPNQFGAPVRVITPWKYGYKSPKSIVKIELVKDRPHTFWNDIQPVEYGFFSNVNPDIPHPRWSQATERRLSTGDRVKTLLHNGYADQVAKLYE